MLVVLGESRGRVWPGPLRAEGWTAHPIIPRSAGMGPQLSESSYLFRAHFAHSQASMHENHFLGWAAREARHQSSSQIHFEAPLKSAEASLPASPASGPESTFGTRYLSPGSAA